MYNFDGQHKAGLNVSLGGASKKVDKTTLLRSAKAERCKRETNRKQNVAATTLQSWYRSCVARKLMVKHYREEFDRLMKQSQQSKETVSVLDGLVQILCVFYHSAEDYNRLISTCQMLLRLSSLKMLDSLMLTALDSWIGKIKKLLLLCCRSLHMSSDINVTIPLRMIEVFTEAKTYSWLGKEKAAQLSMSVIVYLATRDYFSIIRELINVRVPENLEFSSHPPTPFSTAARDLVLKPVTACQNMSADNAWLVQKHFIADLLSPSMTEQICLFLLPAIAASVPLLLFLRSILQIPNTHTTWTLYSFLLICEKRLETATKSEITLFVQALCVLVTQLDNKKADDPYDSNSDSENEDETNMDVDVSIEIPENKFLEFVQEKCLDIINQKSTVVPILLLSEDRHLYRIEKFDEYVKNLCDISCHLLSVLRVQVHKSRFLYSIAYKGHLLKSFWNSLVSMKTTTATGKDVELIWQLSHGQTMSSIDQLRILPLLTVFTSLFRYALFSIYDSDFYGEHSGNSLMPFKLNEMVNMSKILRDVVVGLIMLIYPDVKTVTNNNWLFVCQMVTQLVKQLHSRDSRHRFCSENHWLSAKAAISEESVIISSFFQEDSTKEDDFKPIMSTLNARSAEILKYIPFAVPFIQRVRIFQRILTQDKTGSQGIAQAVLSSHGINITVNRKYLYQDAFDQLSKDRAAEVKSVIRVQMINSQGLDEAGIDGGGVFREFMSQLMRSGLDPSYGFFKSTSQQLLYPNPYIDLIQPDYLKHFHFLGRMLGKIIYESMMVELPLADFFLCKLLNKHGADVDIYHLESLDPELYKNLLYLKNYDGDVDDLALNFTVVDSDYGKTKVQELKPGGRDICVTSSNKIEYIHLMADYRLNKQIRAHCNAFRAGLADVINIEWLQMFDHRELQTLISGAQVPIDINDLRIHTNYSGSFTTDDTYITEFWDLLASLTDKQKRLFLKFVTSCSRPPLLGFSELYPRFCIHYGGEEDRLPTASTCMNFLKLPRYATRELLRTRLLYAIEAEAGFELS